MTSDHPKHTATLRAGQGTAGRPIRLCVMTTVASSIQVLYRGRLEYLQEHGFEVTVVCAPSELDNAIRSRGVRLHTAPLARSISPARDLWACWRLWKFLSRERFDIVEVGTPKAALVGTLAARMAGVRPIVHILHGLVHEGQRGLTGSLLRAATMVSCRLADVTFSVSASARRAAIEAGLVASDRIRVLGHGSCNGVDLMRFRPVTAEQRSAARARLGLPMNALVVGYLGRFTREKGLVELADAFDTLRSRIPHLRLLLVGEFEARESLPVEVTERLKADERVTLVDWQDDPLDCYAAMDVVALPSYREGLGNILPEAGALGIPTIASDATGCRDAMEPEVTGLRVPARETAALRDAIERLATDDDLRARLGDAGPAWVGERFDQHRVWELFAEEYRRLVREAAD